MKRGTNLWRIAVILLVAAFSSAAEKHTISGLVLEVNPSRHSMTVSCQKVPGYMDAMAMPFAVRDVKLLEGVRPGASIDFTLVEDGDSSYAESIRVRRYQNLELEPLEARRLAILSKLAHPSAAQPLNAQQPVPDFTLTDQNRKAISFSQFRGQVVAVNFAYVRCPNPAYCFRLTSNLGELEKRFSGRMGRDLILLTIIIDPEHDQHDAIANYAKIWNANPRTWHFLTGPLPEVQRVSRMFGMEFWNDDALLVHSFHTAIVDRQGKLFANLEGNQFTARQLGDLVKTVLDSP